MKHQTTPNLSIQKSISGCLKIKCIINSYQMITNHLKYYNFSIWCLYYRVCNKTKGKENGCTAAPQL